MSIVEKMQECPTAVTVKVVAVTPELLESHAKRLRLLAASGEVKPGNILMIPLTSEITLMYDPEITKQKFDARPNGIAQ